MRQPYGEAFCWIFQLGPAYTGRGSGGTNTVQWSIRDDTDTAVLGYDWATGVLELSGGGGSYLALIPANVFAAAGRYVIRGRPASSLASSGTEEELIIFVPVATQASVDTVAGYVDTEIAAIKAVVDAVKLKSDLIPAAGPADAAHYTNARGDLLANLDAAMSSRLATSGYTAPDNATIASIYAAVDTEIAALTTAVAAVNTLATAINAKTTNLPSDPADESLIIAATDALTTAITTTQTALAAAITALGTPAQADDLSAVLTQAEAIAERTDGLPDDPADQSVLAALIASAQTSLNSITTALTARLDAAVSTRATPADVDVQVEADLASLIADVAAIKLVVDQIPLVWAAT